mgnify:CR=1 FL=1
MSAQREALFWKLSDIFEDSSGKVYQKYTAL